MKKKYIALIMAVSVTTLFAAGCGSSSSTDSKSTYYEGDAGSENNYYAEEAASESYNLSDSASDVLTGDISGNEQTEVLQSDQKMVITYDIALETENYDEALQKIRVSASSVGGYIEYESEYAYSEDERSDSLTIRVPEEQAESWVETLGDYGVIRSRGQSAENVTLQYTDIESRITALRTEQTTLLGIMEKAEAVEDIIAVQTELQNVNYEIEYYESSMRALENSINYSTVNMTIDEVSREVPNSSSLGQEMKESFAQSIENLKNFGRGLVLFFAGNLIMMVIIAGIVCVVIVFIRKGRRRKAMRKAQKGPEKETAETKTE